MNWRIAIVPVKCGRCGGHTPRGAVYATVTEAQKLRCARCVAEQFGAQAPEPSAVHAIRRDTQSGFGTVSDLVAKTLSRFKDIRKAQAGE